MRLILLLTSFSLFFASCEWPGMKKPTQKPTAEVKTTIKTTSTNLPIISNELLCLQTKYNGFNRLNCKADVSITLPGVDQEVNANIRWIADSVIWMNLSLLGIEGGRLLINKDSFFLVDRINDRYMAESLTNLAKKFELPISFPMFQNIILGQPFFLMDSTLVETKTPEKSYWHQADHSWLSDFITSVDKSELQLVSHKKIDKSGFVQQGCTNYVDIKQKEKFSSNRDIRFKSKTYAGGQVVINLKDITINQPKEIKFSIPSGYERMQ